MKISHLRKIMQELPPNAKPMDPYWRMDYIRSMGMEPGDIYQELEMESRFVDTHRDISDVGSAVNLHSHNFYELLYCRSESSVEYLVGTQRYLLQKGDVVIVPPGISHRPLLRRDMQEPYVRDVLWISEEFMRQICRWYPDTLKQSHQSGALLRIDEALQESIGKIFEQGIRESEERRGEWELAVIGNTISLLSQLRRACVDNTVQPMKAEQPEMLDRVLDYIEENLAGKITLGEVAHHFFVSESTITQLFRKKMGVSFYHCVTQRRLIAAKELIDRNVKLDHVSERVGFADYSTFYRAFKKEYGISPVQYRKLQNHA